MPRNFIFRLLFAVALLSGCSSAASAPDRPVVDGSAIQAMPTAVPVMTSVPIAATEPPAPLKQGTRAVGEACSQASECESGACEGRGCGPDEGRCVERRRICTRDLQAYCGCDGKTFRASGTCPGRRYAARGLCSP